MHRVIIQRVHPCKTSLKLTVARTKLLKNKKGSSLVVMNKELAQLHAAGQERTARIRKCWGEFGYHSFNHATKTKLSARSLASSDTPLLGSYLRIVARSGPSVLEDINSSFKDEETAVIYHSTIITLDDVVVESTRSELGGNFFFLDGNSDSFGEDGHGGFGCQENGVAIADV
ncbi:hypothetical protein GIB67_027718 [Kingdonia uniflora]|uniref:Uncharacterized protein n=1 Tax=Kingdonia uniflora TaxID=39325 RepID=A0A7J7NLQ2_9MAGN|nr:hypothetical protein GIB67_027718 [Kingdonia uniflora]